MTSIPRISPKAFAVMQLLKNKPGMYGLEIVEASDGVIKRGTVYVVLTSLLDDGWVSATTEKNPKYAGIPRKLYSLTGEGARVLALKEQVDAIWRGGTENALI